MRETGVLFKHDISSGNGKSPAGRLGRDNLQVVASGGLEVARKRIAVPMIDRELAGPVRRACNATTTTPTSSENTQLPTSAGQDETARNPKTFALVQFLPNWIADGSQAQVAASCECGHERTRERDRKRFSSMHCPISFVEQKRSRPDCVFQCDGCKRRSKAPVQQSVEVEFGQSSFASSFR